MAKRTHSYLIQITDDKGHVYQHAFNDVGERSVDWCMEQYSRNRHIVEWEVMGVNNEASIDKASNQEGLHNQHNSIFTAPKQ